MMERSTSKITLAESVYERIRRDIITNQLKPGEKIQHSGAVHPIRSQRERPSDWRSTAWPLRISSSISPARECGSNR